MTFEEFRNSPSEPSHLIVPLRALWHDAREGWEIAHRLVQDDVSAEAAWVHAYLHRKEGDSSNARYWYGRARKPAFEGTLLQEWEGIVRALLSA